MHFAIQKADRRHLPDINRLIVDAKIGDPMTNLEGEFWFIRQGARIVGCMGGTQITDDSVILTHLAVERGYRKQGIGMTLFHYAEEYFRARGCRVFAFITMYYLYNRFKKRGYKVVPRVGLPQVVRDHWMFTAQRYKKCGAMIKVAHQKEDL